MAVAFRSAATPTHGQAVNSGNAAQIVLPGDVTGGDLILVRVAFNNGSTLTAPTGYTQLHSLAKSTLTLTTFWKLAAGTVGGSSTDAGATVSGPMPVTGSAYAMTAEVYSGVDQTTPVNTAAIVAEAVATITHTSPTITTTVAGCWVSESVCDKGSPSSTGYTYGTGLAGRSTSVGTGTASSSLGVADGAASVSAGTAGGHTITGTLSTSTAVMSTVAIAPAAPTGSGAMSSGTVFAGTLSSPGGAGGMSSGTALTGAGTIVTAAAVGYLTAGAPTPGGVTVVAGRVTGVAALSLAVSTSPTMTSPTATGPVTADGDGFYRFVVTGQPANTRLYYQLTDSVAGPFGPVTSAWTAPASGGRVSFDVTLGACVDNAATDGVALAAAITRAPRLSIFTGDQSYRGSTSTTRSVHEAQILDQAAAVPSYPAYTRQVLLTCNSDHDAGPDNGPSNLTDAPYMRASIDAALHYSANPVADVRSPVVGRYFSVTYGAVKFIVIDVRNTDRTTVTATGTSTDTMLGATQKTWLKAELITGEPYKVIVSDTAWMGADDNTGGTPVKGDWWPAYPAERNELIAYIAAHPEIGQLELWHGDSHLIGYATAAKNTWGGFPVLCAAGFNETGGGRDTSTFSAFWNNSGGPVRQYGYVTFVDDGTTITRTFTGYDASSGTDVSRVSSVQTVTAPTSGMSSGSAFGGAATRAQPATGGMVSGTALTGTTTASRPAAASISSGTSLTGAPVRTTPAAGGMSSGSQLTAAATYLAPATAGMTSGTAFTGAASRAQSAAAGMSSGTSFTASTSGLGPGAGGMVSGTALTVAGTGTYTATATMSSSTALVGGGVRQTAGAAVMGSGTALSGAATRTQPAGTGMTSASALTGAGVRVTFTTATMTSGTLLAGDATIRTPAAGGMVSATTLTSRTQTHLPRDLTLTYTIGSGRWAAVIGGDRWAAKVGTDRWDSRSTP